MFIDKEVDKMEQASELEIMNAKKVLEYLSNMNGISYKIVRDDIFSVMNIENGAECIIDVEESIVCVYTEVCDVPDNATIKAELNDYLMGLNNAAVHGKFTKNTNKIFFRDNLEFENLDQNELDASLKWAFGMVSASIEKIATIIG